MCYCLMVMPLKYCSVSVLNAVESKSKALRRLSIGIISQQKNRVMYTYNIHLHTDQVHSPNALILVPKANLIL